MKNLIIDLEKTMLEVQQMDREMSLSISNTTGDLKQQLFDKKNELKNTSSDKKLVIENQIEVLTKQITVAEKRLLESFNAKKEEIIQKIADKVVSKKQEIEKEIFDKTSQLRQTKNNIEVAIKNDNFSRITKLSDEAGSIKKSLEALQKDYDSIIKLSDKVIKLTSVYGFDGITKPKTISPISVGSESSPEETKENDNENTKSSTTDGYIPPEKLLEKFREDLKKEATNLYSDASKRKAQIDFFKDALIKLTSFDETKDLLRKEDFDMMNSIIASYNTDIKRDAMKKEAEEIADEEVEKKSFRQILKLNGKRIKGKLKKNENVNFMDTIFILVKKNNLSKMKLALLLDGANKLKKRDRKIYDRANKAISKRLFNHLLNNRSEAKVEMWIELLKTMPDEIKVSRNYSYSFDFVAEEAKYEVEKAFQNKLIDKNRYNELITKILDIVYYRRNVDDYYYDCDQKLYSYVDSESENIEKNQRQIVK